MENLVQSSQKLELEPAAFPKNSPFSNPPDTHTASRGFPKVAMEVGGFTTSFLSTPRQTISAPWRNQNHDARPERSRSAWLKPSFGCWAIYFSQQRGSKPRSHHPRVDAHQRRFAQTLSSRHISASNPQKSGTPVRLAAPLGPPARPFLSAS